ncbi:hypothetical protein [Labrys sp. WJW]|nr:hypothetical protein [Labrys sp. WJW]
MTTLIVSRRHLRQPPLRVRVEKRARRLARAARNMAAAGLVAWQIRRATGLGAKRLEVVLADTTNGLWSAADLKLMKEIGHAGK